MLQGPSSQHILGTDEVGRDVAARLLYAGRISIPVSLAAMAVALIAASVIENLAQHFVGWLDMVPMRVADALLSTPTILLLLTIAAVLRRNKTMLIAVIGLLAWMDVSRILRVQTIALAAREQIEAACALGASSPRIIVKHILPNMQGPLLVAAPLVAARALLTESALSFLGLGIQPPTPTWGNMLNQVQQFALSAPLLAVAPGLAIILVVIAINFVGDGIRDAFDPRVTNRHWPTGAPDSTPIAVKVGPPNWRPITRSTYDVSVSFRNASNRLDGRAGPRRWRGSVHAGIQPWHRGRCADGGGFLRRPRPLPRGAAVY